MINRKKKIKLITVLISVFVLIVLAFCVYNNYLKKQEVEKEYRNIVQNKVIIM